MLLSKKEIIELCEPDEATKSLIEPILQENVKGASYDLRLGEKCFCSSTNGKGGIQKLKENGDKVLIPQHSIFFFQTLEKVNIPSDIAGKLSLRMGLIRKGLIMPSHTQIDPGYSNYLFGMIYNLSDSAVELTKGDHLVSIEFMKLSDKTEDYADEYEKYIFEQFVEEKVSSSLGYLANKYEEQYKTIKRIKFYYKAAISLFALISIIVAIIGIAPYFKNISRIDKNQEEISKLKETLARLETNINFINTEIISPVKINGQNKKIQLIKKIIKLEKEQKIISDQLKKPNK